MMLHEWHIFSLTKILPSASRVDKSHYQKKVSIFEPMVPQKVTDKCNEENGKRSVSFPHVSI